MNTTSIPDISEVGESKIKTISIHYSSELKVKGWNWGPFTLTFVWAIFHGFWVLGILSLIPGVGLIIGIILGIKGNNWAWEKDKNKNYHLFMEQQSRWNKIGIISIFIYILMFLFMHILIILSLILSPPKIIEKIDKNVSVNNIKQIDKKI